MIAELTQSIQQTASKHIDKKLRNRMIMYCIISIAILGVTIYELIISSLSRRIALLAIVIGLALGMVTHRIFAISWHEDEQKVISRIDRLGGVILVVYILFSIFRGKIIEYFFHGPAVLAVTMAFVFGLMFGRVLGMSRRIFSILKEQEILG